MSMSRPTHELSVRALAGHVFLVVVTPLPRGHAMLMNGQDCRQMAMLLMQAADVAEGQRSRCGNDECAREGEPGKSGPST